MQNRYRNVNFEAERAALARSERRANRFFFVLAAVLILTAGAGYKYRANVQLWSLTGSFDLCTLPARQTAPAYRGECNND
jgi:hypothetical protein